jgi:hypothetical protein
MTAAFIREKTVDRLKRGFQIDGIDFKVCLFNHQKAHFCSEELLFNASLMLAMKSLIKKQ